MRRNGRMTVDSKSGKRKRVVCHNNSFLCLRLANELLLAVCLPLGLHGARGDTNAHSIDLLSLLSHPRRLWFVGGLEDLCPSHARSHGCAQRPARRLRLLYIPPPIRGDTLTCSQASYLQRAPSTTPANRRPVCVCA